MSIDPGAEFNRQTMAHALAAIVYSSHPDLTLDFANRYALEYFGLKQDQVAGDHWLELVHPDDRASVIAAWDASLATGHPYHHVHRLRLANGEYRTFTADALPLRDESGEVLKWYGVLTPANSARPRYRGPRNRSGKVNFYPLRDECGQIHLVAVTTWTQRPADAAASQNDLGYWFKLEHVDTA
jgi:PAS domain S-box-containing protein